MLKSLEGWKIIAEGVFPEGARLLEMPRETGDWLLLVSWRVGTDRARPNRRSKTVRVTVSEEALEDYARSPAGPKRAADMRFERWLRRELGAFEPGHDTPYGVEPPVVRWVLGTIELNG